MRLDSEKGFSALELLVIIVIVCTLVGIGVPVLHAQTKQSVLDSNLRSLGSMVKESVAEGYSPEYLASGEGDPAAYLSLQLEHNLSAAGEAGYINPFVGSASGRVVINGRAIPSDPESAAPAVFITDAAEAQYHAVDALPETVRRLLSGTLVIAFDPSSLFIDVFYIDGEGNKSPAAVNVPIL
ncbi:MAG TPA: type II secretion system protein [Thermoleophilia bacterium]|nr:type II secretion system protein [Thermoleophilia bacterium]